MSVTKEVIQRYPISSLVFILTTGLFVVLFFPYELSGLFTSDGVVLQDCISFIAESGKNFKPFIYVNELKSDFIVGSTKILISGFFVGIFFYLLNDLFMKINHWVMGGRIKKRITSIKSENKTELQVLDFSIWAKDYNFAKFSDFIYSMKQLITGLIYACETIWAITLLTLIIVVLSGSIGQLYLSKVFWWFVIYSICFILIYVLHINYEISYAKQKEDLWKKFQTWQERKKKETG